MRRLTIMTHGAARRAAAIVGATDTAKGPTVAEASHTRTRAIPVAPEELLSFDAGHSGLRDWTR